MYIIMYIWMLVRLQILQNKVVKKLLYLQLYMQFMYMYT